MLLSKKYLLTSYLLNGGITFIKEVIGGMPIYMCKICEMQGKRVEFYKRDDLREHIKSVHPDYVERILSLN